MKDLLLPMETCKKPLQLLEKLTCPLGIQKVAIKVQMLRIF
jgi:hypothetical protein